MSKLWTHADTTMLIPNYLTHSDRASGWCRGGAMHFNFNIITSSTYGQRSSRHRYQKRKITKKNCSPKKGDQNIKSPTKKKWKTAFERKKTQKKWWFLSELKRQTKRRTTELWGSRWSRRCKRWEHKHSGGKKAKQGKYILMKKGEYSSSNKPKTILRSKINQQMEGGWSIMNDKWG